MLNDLEVRKIIYSSDLIDKTFFEEKSNEEFLKSLKPAKKIYIRYPSKKWKIINFNNLINIFKDKEVVSSGVVAIPHNAKRHKYTQYCGKLLCKSQKLGIVEIDIEFYIYWNSDFSSKK